ncbi:MAG: hypothetical protein HYV09_16450 [Deltaproteobacteria bacterium]|nr:hypothetical protein [Deltaproteobacteria bacterium]
MSEPNPRLELDDGSGPVSPRFQWSVRFVAEGARARLHSKGAPLGEHDRELAIDAAALRTLCDELSALSLADLVDDQRAARVGTRVNTLSVGDAHVRYLASDVDERLAPTDVTRPIREARARVLAFIRAALQNT